MASSAAEDKGWTFDAFDPGTMREYNISRPIHETMRSCVTRVASCFESLFVILYRACWQEGAGELPFVSDRILQSAQGHRKCTRRYSRRSLGLHSGPHCPAGLARDTTYFCLTPPSINTIPGY